MVQIQKFVDNVPVLKGYGGAAITMLQLIIISSSYKAETTEKTRAPYSKFAGKETNDVTTLPSRVGMLIIYTPALMVAVIQHIVPLYWSTNQTLNSSVAGLFCLIHFLKRDLEVLYLHEYSGRIPLLSSIQIGVFYGLISFLVCSVSTTSPSANLKIVGTFLFTVGELGNFYHHYLLANLRSGIDSTSTDNNKSMNKYVAPHGGLFAYVATPHYFFELVAWYGIGVVSNHINVYLAAAGMTSYLSGRAYSQNEWNRKMFGKKEWPPSRKDIVPFLF